MFLLSLHTTRRGSAFYRVVPGVKLNETLFLTGFFMSIPQRGIYGAGMGFFMPEREVTDHRAARVLRRSGCVCKRLETL
jgi:hypothetical protein